MFCFEWIYSWFRCLVSQCFVLPCFCEKCSLIYHICPFTVIHRWWIQRSVGQLYFPSSLSFFIHEHGFVGNILIKCSVNDLWFLYSISLTSVLKFLQTFLHDVSIPFNLPMSNDFIHTIYWVYCCIFVPPPLIKYLALMFVEFHSQLSSTSIVSLLECYSNYSLSQFFSCFAIFFF